MQNYNNGTKENPPNETPANSYLILWNNGNYAKSLSKALGNQRIVTSFSELKNLNFEDSNYAGAVVLIELDWENHKHSDLFGIKIVSDFLRAKRKLKFPILFVSFLTFKQILINENGKQKLNNQIAGAIGHYFLRLPATPQIISANLEDLPELNNFQFRDIYSNLCYPKGLVGGQIHNIQGKIRSLEASNPSNLKSESKIVFEKCLDEIADLLNGVTEVIEKNEQYKSDFQTKISDPTNSAKILEFLELYRKDINRLIPLNENEINYENIGDQEEKKSWKALILDDEQDSLINLKNQLIKRGIAIIEVTTVEKAEQEIVNDVYNEITVVIADYRLLEIKNHIEVQQRKQGYDFLLWLSQQNHRTHLVALSGLSRKFLLESFHEYYMKVDVHSKEDLTGNLKLFIDNIIDRGNEIYEETCSGPSIGFWKPLRLFYTAHKTSKNKVIKELEINERAEQFLKPFINYYNKKNQISDTQPHWIIPKNLTAKLEDKSPNDNKALEIFYNQMTARRIALYLYSMPSFKNNDLFAAFKGFIDEKSMKQYLKNKLKEEKNIAHLPDHEIPEEVLEEIKKDVNKKYLRDSKLMITSHLAISAKLIEYELFVEERFWLKNIMGVKYLDSSYDLERYIPYLVQIFVDKLFERTPEIETRLKENKPNLFFKYKIDDEEKFGAIQILGPIEAKEVIESISKFVNNDEEITFQKFLKVLYQIIEFNVTDGHRKNDFLNFMITFMRLR